jgi:hypothetical protein
MLREAVVKQLLRTARWNIWREAATLIMLREATTKNMSREAVVKRL